jgi:CcmD family protein
MKYFTAAFVISWVIYFAYLFFIDKKLTRLENRIKAK